MPSVCVCVMMDLMHQIFLVEKKKKVFKICHLFSWMLSDASNAVTFIIIHIIIIVSPTRDLHTLNLSSRTIYYWLSNARNRTTLNN